MRYTSGMQISLETNHEHYAILGYTPGLLTLVQPRRVEAPSTVEERKKMVSTSCILMPGYMSDTWPPQTFDDLTAEHFAALLALKPELVVLGTGAKLRFPKPDRLAPLINQGIGVEVMDTPAACRTYNFLMVDGRNVLAALLL
ncbi:MAG: Mth938-like domain-containing protein [Gammaproteobacteria bacterium]|nr:Mth938-like domain-containing protein [Gammaproteobacteria bacterium]